MIGFFILVVFSLLPFVSTWITSPQDIFVEIDGLKKDKKIFKKKTSKRLTKRGWSFIGIAILTICFAWFQYKENIRSTQVLQNQLALRDSINRNELRIRDNQSRREQQVRDSLNNAENRLRDSISQSEIYSRDILASERIEKGKNETISLLSKYNLRQDSSQKRIEALVKDSSKIIDPNIPDFNLCNDTGLVVSRISKFEYDIKLRLCNLTSPSKKVNLSFYIVTKDTFNQLVYRGELSAIPKNSEFSTGAVITSNKNTIVSSTPISEVYLLVTGTYADSKGRSLISVNNLVSYTISVKQYGMPTRKENDEVRAFFRKKLISN